MITAKVLPDLKLEGQGESQFRQLLAHHIGRVVIIYAKRPYKPRTDQQLKTVMGLWRKIILTELGYENSDWDYLYPIFKIEAGWYDERVNKKTGEVMKVPRETKRLPTDQYSKFMEDFARNIAVNHGITLPDPISTMAII